MPLTAHDPVRPAVAGIPDDALAQLARLGQPSDGPAARLSDSDIQLIFMTFGPVAEECLRRRKHMRTLHALTDPNVVYLFEDQTGNQTGDAGQ